MELVLGTVAATVVALAAGWFLGTPRIKALLWRQLPTLPRLLHAKPPDEVVRYERQHNLEIPPDWLEPIEVESWHVDVEVVETRWLPEVEELRRLAARFWEATRERFGQFGTLGKPTLRDGLSDRVRAAVWPDEFDESADWELDDGETLAPQVSAFFLRDFANRLYEHDTASFEEVRREMAILVNRWWTRAEGNAAFEHWLASKLGPVDISTLKLLWYVEVAWAKSLKNEGPDYRPYEFLRAVLTRPEQHAQS